MNEGPPFIVLGAGGHAAVVADLLLQKGVLLAGFVAPDNSEGIFELPLLGDDNWLATQSTQDFRLANGIGSVKDTTLRRKLFKYFSKLGWQFPALVDSRAICSRQAYFAPGSQVMAGAVIQCRAHIGMNSIINSGAIVDHDTKIGDHCHIAPGATLSGSVKIGDGCHIGTGASVIHNVTIGQHSVIGAGAVVIADVDPGEVVVGIPARPTMKKL